MKINKTTIYSQNRLFSLIVILLVTFVSGSVVAHARLHFEESALSRNTVGTEKFDAISNGVAGDYSGQATLQGIYNGVLSNTSAVSTTMDLGYVDLAFNLSQSGQNLAGSVILSRTLVFSATEGNIAVTGSMNGSNLHLESGKFTMKMNEARMIGNEQVAPERIVTRQFSLDTEQVLNDGATLLGIYRETIWGYAPEPVTVVGKFALERPLFSTMISTSPRRVFSPLVRRQ